MLSPGDRVKDCEVIAPLGSGGMATLYLARRRGVGGFSRLVTLKLVHPHLVGDESVIKLFLDEARISAHIAHPNVVHVEDVGEYDGSYFIAMEYVHGVSLAELLARLDERHLRLRRKLCVWLAAQIAEALHAAHEAKSEQGTPLGIVHRDVSPQNVLIAHTGHVKLIDFGIAKSQAEADHRTYGRPVLGKLRYMSPEQLRLERADRRVDVYALGVVLWEMLTGRNLLRCQRFDDERDWRTREDPPKPSRYAGHCPAALDLVVLKAIAYDSSERYDSALQLRSALLQADPEALRIDAPTVAALMRTLLGDELARRRARWPREIVAELDATPGITVSGSWSIDELTDTLAAAPAERTPREVAPAATRAPAHERDDEPTFARWSPSDDAATTVQPSGPRQLTAQPVGDATRAAIARVSERAPTPAPARRRSTTTRQLSARSVARTHATLQAKLALCVTFIRRAVAAVSALLQRAAARPRAVLRSGSACVTRSAGCAMVSACIVTRTATKTVKKTASAVTHVRATGCIARTRTVRRSSSRRRLVLRPSTLSWAAAVLDITSRHMKTWQYVVYRVLRARLPMLGRPRPVSIAISGCFALSFFISTFLLRGVPCEPSAQAQRPPPKAAPSVAPQAMREPSTLLPRALPVAAATTSPLLPPAAPAPTSERDLRAPALADAPPVQQPEARATRSAHAFPAQPSPYGSYRGSARIANQIGGSAAISSRPAWRRRLQLRAARLPTDKRTGSELSR